MFSSAQILSISDIVLNHTANESPWLAEYPESAYNLTNSPHLRPSYLLDRLLQDLAVDIGAGKHHAKGIEATITCEDQIQVVHFHGVLNLQIKLFIINS